MTKKRQSRSVNSVIRTGLGRHKRVVGDGDLKKMRLMLRQIYGVHNMGHLRPDDTKHVGKNMVERSASMLEGLLSDKGTSITALLDLVTGVVGGGDTVMGVAAIADSVPSNVTMNDPVDPIPASALISANIASMNKRLKRKGKDSNAPTHIRPDYAVPTDGAAPATIEAVSRTAINDMEIPDSDKFEGGALRPVSESAHMNFDMPADPAPRERVAAAALEATCSVKNAKHPSVMRPQDSMTTTDRPKASLRPTFLIGGEGQVDQTQETRVANDTGFDMFGFVPEGYGLGGSNKLFVENGLREDKIEFAEQMYTPRNSEGGDAILGGLRPIDPRLSNSIPAVDILTKLVSVVDDIQRTVKRMSDPKSAFTIPDDNNNIRSSRGLRNKGPQPFIPVIDHHSPMIPLFPPAGAFMNRRMKSIFNPQTTPQRHDELNPMNGRPTLGPRSSLAVLLP